MENIINFLCSTEVRSMLQLPDQVLINKIEAKIMTYYRFLKSFLQINERLDQEMKLLDLVILDFLLAD